MTERKTAILLHLREHGPGTAREVAEAVWPGTDPRGAGQTLRRLRDDEGYVRRDVEGVWKLTGAGRDKARRLAGKLATA